MQILAWLWQACCLPQWNSLGLCQASHTTWSFHTCWINNVFPSREEFPSLNFMLAIHNFAKKVTTRVADFHWPGSGAENPDIQNTSVLSMPTRNFNPAHSSRNVFPTAKMWDLFQSLFKISSHENWFILLAVKYLYRKIF